MTESTDLRNMNFDLPCDVRDHAEETALAIWGAIERTQKQIEFALKKDEQRLREATDEKAAEQYRKDIKNEQADLKVIESISERIDDILLMIRDDFKWDVYREGYTI